MNNRFWYKVARTIIKAGSIPVPITDALIKLLQTILSEELATFILNFRQPSLNMKQIKDKTNLNEEEIRIKLKPLMEKGIIIESKSINTGIIVYRLLPLLPGIFEYSFMKGKTDEKDIKLAHLYDKVFDEISQGTQRNYDNVVEQFKLAPPIDRVIPVQHEIESIQEVIIPSVRVAEIIENNSSIAIANCYCRHQKELMNEPCKMDAPKENCLMFGKSAQFAIKYNFAKPISKERAKQILKESEDLGLVHNAFHVHQNYEKDIESICNCCKCCCMTFQMYYRGIASLHTNSSFIADLDNEICISCGNCIEKCPVEALTLVDNKVIHDENLCIGCGLCVSSCPNDAISLIKTGIRDIFIPPRRIQNIEKIKRVENISLNE
ncbi:MAG: indolepyruvate ferredoxin oxidoreductase subunit alpha [Candidatus Odinarchaeota archaeon]